MRRQSEVHRIAALVMVLMGMAAARNVYLNLRPFLNSYEEISRLEKQNAELKRQNETMRQWIAKFPPEEPVLCAGAYGDGCGNGPMPPTPGDRLR